MVSNGERYQEVAQAAENSEDAGLLQYSKTLDSLETKLNNIKTSFQQFYMQIFNGPVVGGALELINKLITGFNKLGTVSGIANLISSIIGIKNALNLVVNFASDKFGGILSEYKKFGERFVQEALNLGKRAGVAQAKGQQEGYSQTMAGNAVVINQPANSSESASEIKGFFKSNWAKIAQIAGGVLSAAGAAASNSSRGWGTTFSTFGSIASGVGTGFTMSGGNPIGALIGGIVGLTSQLPAIASALDKSVQLQDAANKAEEEAQNKNVERAQAQQDLSTLKSYLDKYNDMAEKRFNSDEDMAAWKDFNNEIADKYPQLISYIDEEGNALVSLEKDTSLLDQAMQAAAKSTHDYYKARTEADQKALDVAINQATIKSSIIQDRISTIIGTSNGGLPTTPLARDLLGAGSIGLGEFLDKIEESLGLDINDLNYILSVENQESIFSPDFVNSRYRENVDKSFGTNIQIIGQILEEAGFAAYDTETGALRIDTGLINQRKQQVAQKEALLNSDTKAWKMATATQMAYQYEDQLGELANMAGFSAIIASRADTAEYIEENFDELIDPLIAIRDNLAGSEEKTAEFMSLWDNLDNYSYLDLMTLLYSYGNSGKQILSAFDKEWQSKYLEANNRAYGLFSSNIDLRNKIFGENSVISDLTPTDLNNLSKYYSQELTYQKSADTGARIASETRVNIIGGLVANLLNKEVTPETLKNTDFGDLSSLKEDERRQLAQILQTDAGSLDWKNNILSFLNEKEIEVTQKGLETLQDITYVLLDTWVQTTIDSMSSVNEKLAEFSKSQQQGFKIEEAKKFIDDINKSQATNYEVAELFTTLDDGRIVLQNAEESIRLWLEGKQQEINTLIDEINDIGGVDNGGDLLRLSSEHIPVREAINDAWRNYKETHEEATFEDFKEYYTESLKIAGQSFTKQAEESLKDLSKLDFTEKMSAAATEISFDPILEIFTSGLTEISDAQVEAIGALLGYNFDAVVLLLGLESLGNGQWKINNKDFTFAGSLEERKNQLFNLYQKSQSDEDVLAWYRFSQKYFDQDENGLFKIVKPEYKKYSDELLKLSNYIKKTALDSIFEDGILSAEEFANLDEDFAAFLSKELTFDETTGKFDVDEETLNALIEAADNDLWKAILERSKKNYKFANDAFTKKIAKQEGASTFFSSMLSGKAGFDDVTKLAESFKISEEKVQDNQSAISDLLSKTAEAVLEGNLQAAYDNYLQIIETLGLDTSDIDTSSLQAQLQDAIISLGQQLSSAILSAAEGTLSSENWLTLVRQRGLKSTDYRDYGGIMTENGIRLSQEGILRAASEGNFGYDTISKIAQQYSGTNGILGTLESVDEEIKAITGNTGKYGDETANVLRILQQIKATYMQMGNAPIFDFMNNNSFGGGADGFFTFASNMETAFDSLKAAADNEGKISGEDFVGIFTQLEKVAGADWVENLGGSAKTFEEFFNIAASTIDHFGNIDLSAVATNLGIGMDSLINSMGSGLDTGLKDVAKSQADWWNNYADFLENLDKLNNDLEGEKIELPTIDNTVDYNDEGILIKYVDKYKKAFEIIDKAMPQLQLGDIIKVDDGFTPEEVEEINKLVEVFNALSTNSLSDEQAGAIANYLKTIDTSLPAADRVNGLYALAGILTTPLPEENPQAKALTETGEAAKAADEAVKELTTDVKGLNDVKAAPSVTVQLPNYGEIENSLNYLARNRTSTINIEYKEGGVSSSTGGGGAGGNKPTLKQIQAKGNVALAKGTLVGELGPELVVSNGLYHVVGANGPEIVNLANDAIVFNHLQTEQLLSHGSANGRGKAINGEQAAVAKAKGDAAASGIQAAAKEARRIAKLWEKMADLPVNDLLDNASGGGGGGGGNSLKAHIADLQEWYNLSRQIADVEQQINNILAERENITDGRAYLRNLREQQELLRSQALTQNALLKYQKDQLKLQKDLINTNSIWSQFLTVDDSGLLQYIKGNETNGGKGALEVLSNLNKMSGKEQVDFLKQLGYTYTDNDGNKLEGEELVSKFYEELQEQIDKYDELYDTVNGTIQTLEKLEQTINDVNEEIRQNQIDLEQELYDIVVDSWEKEIDQLEKQTELIKEANEAYTDGISKALQREKDAYSQNQSTEDRMRLQRQLSLLRRTDGSASEIANLERQLDDKLRDEYFNHQQESIDQIKEANDQQVKALEEQITIQRDSLEYQKENGVIWQKVYEVLAGTDAEIIAWMSGNAPDFFTKSGLAAEEAIMEWSKKVGIYKGNIEGSSWYNEGMEAFNNGAAWQGQDAKYLSAFNRLTPEEQEAYQKYYASSYANAKLDNMSDEDAAWIAQNNMLTKLNSDVERFAALDNPRPEEQTGSGGSGTSSSSGGSSNKLRITYSTNNVTLSGNPSSLAVGGSATIKYTCKNGYILDSVSVTGPDRNYLKVSSGGPYYSGGISISCSGGGSATLVVKAKVNPLGDQYLDELKQYKDNQKNIAYAASGTYTGDQEGLLYVHKKERVLNAPQTEAFETLVSTLTNDNPLLRFARNYSSSITGQVGSYDFGGSQDNSVTIEQGAVVLQVQKLDNEYDLDDIAADIEDRLVRIANRSSGRGINRR